MKKTNTPSSIEEKIERIINGVTSNYGEGAGYVHLENSSDNTSHIETDEEKELLRKDVFTLIQKEREEAVRGFEEYTHRFDGFLGLKAIMEQYLSQTKGGK